MDLLKNIPFLATITKIIILTSLKSLMHAELLVETTIKHLKGGYLCFSLFFTSIFSPVLCVVCWFRVIATSVIKKMS